MDRDHTISEEWGEGETHSVTDGISGHLSSLLSAKVNHHPNTQFLQQKFS